ncbi:MAG TPA: pyridine nucleotide-disulfide oxidoreductase [Propionibacteriaceae bacterium]|nr:pyridine nucleotide-disulfide oxidoreductase [Propionibacteriaceae bacterium]
MDERALVVVGGGPAGMAAALSAWERGVRDILLLERDRHLGGILNQCVHPGFGLVQFKETLTGPEYADRFVQRVRATREIEVNTGSFVAELKPGKVLTYFKPGEVRSVRAGALVMATGCRERTREMIQIPGSRPAGVFSAGFAQRMMNIEGLLPGRRVVVIGSGDIGLIMARRLSLEGATVSAVVEIQRQPTGLKRNIVQCLDDFGISLYLGHRVAWIHGKDRVEAVDVAAVDELGCEVAGGRFSIPCDTVLVSVGLIPENELIEMAGAEINRRTNTPVSSDLNYTSIPGLFVCGNAYRVYDIVDSVTRDSVIAGRQAAEYLAAG